LQTRRKIVTISIVNEAKEREKGKEKKTPRCRRREHELKRTRKER
jgi:hypothetical protein